MIQLSWGNGCKHGVIKVTVNTSRAVVAQAFSSSDQQADTGSLCVSLVYREHSKMARAMQK